MALGSAAGRLLVPSAGDPSPRRLGPEKRGGEKPTSCPSGHGGAARVAISPCLSSPSGGWLRRLSRKTALKP